MPAPDLDRLNLLLSLGRYAEGEKAAREAIAADPEWGPGYSFLALFLLNQGHPGRARIPARDGVGKAPHDSWAHAVLATVLGRLFRFDEGYDAIAESLRLDPTYAYAHQVKASLLCKDERYRRAIEAARDGLGQHPDHEHLLYWLGWAQYKLNRWQEALATSETGLRSHPRSPFLLYVRACSLHAMAERLDGFRIVRKVRLHREAETAYLDAVRIDPSEPAYRDNRRLNALACRRSLVPFVAAAFFTLTIALGTLVVSNPFPVCLSLGAIALFFTCVLMSVYAGSDSELSALPVGRFGIPTASVTRLSLWRGRIVWLLLALAWVVLTAGVVLIVATQPAGPK